MSAILPVRNTAVITGKPVTLRCHYHSQHVIPIPSKPLSSDFPLARPFYCTSCVRSHRHASLFFCMPVHGGRCYSLAHVSLLPSSPSNTSKIDSISYVESLTATLYGTLAVYMRPLCNFCQSFLITENSCNPVIFGKNFQPN